jgi:uncharacterized protein
MRTVFVLFLFASVSAFGQTYTVDKVPYDNLKDRYDYVSNPDGILSAAAEQHLNTGLRAVEDSVSVEFAVVLLKSIGAEDIDDFGTKLFTKWGIGKKSKDNGLLFLLVEDSHQMIFRTGYGVEGVLPDVVLARVMRNDITPLMREGKTDEAILMGMGDVCNYLLNPDTVQEILAQEKREQKQDWTSTVIPAIVILVLFFIISSRMSKQNRNDDDNNTTSGSSRGGGFFPPIGGGFGGGRSGGGFSGGGGGGFSGGRTGGGGARGGW